MSSTRVRGLAGRVRAASECPELLSFFSVLNKWRNCIQADGDHEISFVRRLVCRTWFEYVAKVGYLILTLERADSHPFVDGTGDA